MQSTSVASGGTLTACVGDTILLTCSHDNHATGVTRWIFSFPVNCSKTIDHNPPIFSESCGPFTFQNVTEFGSNELLNSTAAALGSASISGTIVECRDSSGSVYNSIGSIFTCIIGMILLLQCHDHPASFFFTSDHPENLTITKEGEITWEAVPCVDNGVKYTVEIKRRNDSDAVYMKETEDTKLFLPDLEIGENYTAFITPVLHGSCSGIPAVLNFISPTSSEFGLR